MEAFYASVEAETSLSNLQNTQPSTVSVRTKPSEETQKALQILRDFLTKKFPLLLHPGSSVSMKDNLKYLLSLSPDKGVSLRTKSIMLQLSATFDEWSLDYAIASLKLESAEAGLSKADKLKEEVDANVKKFREVEMVEKILCDQLACLEERKITLEEEMNVIKAKIGDFAAKRVKMARRKEKVFNTGRLVKAERDDLRNQVPRLKAKQEFAKITKAKIEAEWSKLGAQFIESVSFKEPIEFFDDIQRMIDQCTP